MTSPLEGRVMATTTDGVLMSDDQRAAPTTSVDSDDLPTRQLLPEERATGDYDAAAASDVLLQESEERVNDENAGIGQGSGEQEHRRSEDTV
jgi:hypothetical protein